MLWLAASLPDALVGVAPDTMAHSACDSTIGQRRRGKRSFRRVWSRIESRTAPKTKSNGVVTFMSSEFCGAGRNATGFVQFDYTPK
jgi:hypothetical protein